MKIIKTISLVVITLGLVIAVIKKDNIMQFFQFKEEYSPIFKTTHTHGMQEAEGHFYQGEVVSVEHGGGYTYLEIKEKTELTFWIVVERSSVNIGDYVQFQEQLVTQNFKSEALNKTFEELMFASSLQYRVSE